MLSKNEISIKRNIAYSAVLTISQYIFPLIIFPYISRVLGPENIGKVEFADSLVAYFILFSSLGINILGIREIAKNRNDEFKLNQTFSSLLFIHAILTLIFFIFYFIAIFLYFERTIHYKLVIIGSGKLLFSFLLVEWVYKGLENFKLITIRSIAIKVLYLISIFLFVKTKNDYLIYWFLTVGAIIINALVNIVLSRKYVKLDFKNIIIKPFLKPYFYLGLYLIFTSLYTTFNIVFLGLNSPPAQVGYYTTAIKIYGALLGFYTAYTNVMLPRMSFLISEDNKNKYNSIITKSFSILFALGIPLLIFSFLYSTEIVYIIAGPGFEGAVPALKVVLFLIIIVGVGQVCSVQVLIPYKKDSKILFISILGAFVGIILNLIFVKKYQAIGSAYVLLISETVVSSLLVAACYLFVKITIPTKLILNNFLVYFPLLAILYLFRNIFECHFLIEMLFAGLIAALYIMLVQYFILKNELLHQQLAKLKK